MISNLKSSKIRLLKGGFTKKFLLKLNQSINILRFNTLFGVHQKATGNKLYKWWSEQRIATPVHFILLLGFIFGLGSGLFVSTPNKKPAKASFIDGYGHYDTISLISPNCVNSGRMADFILDPTNNNIGYFNTYNDNKICKIDLLTNEISTLYTSSYRISAEMEISSDGKYIYFVSDNYTDIRRIDIKTNPMGEELLIDSLTAPTYANQEQPAIALSPDDTRLYVMPSQDHGLYYYDIQTGTFSDILIGSETSGGVVDGSLPDARFGNYTTSMFFKNPTTLTIVDGDWSYLREINLNLPVTVTTIYNDELYSVDADSDGNYYALKGQNEVIKVSGSTPHNLLENFIIETQGKSWDCCYINGVELTSDNKTLYVNNNYDLFKININPDGILPVFQNLSSSSQKINVTENQIIRTSPINVKTKPTDASGIQKVEYYLDTKLIAIDYAADSDGVYESSLDINLGQNKPGGVLLKAKAYDNYQNIAEYTVNIILDPMFFPYRTLVENLGITQPTGVVIDRSNTNIFYVASGSSSDNIKKIVYENGNYNISNLTSGGYSVNQMVSDSVGNYMYFGGCGGTTDSGIYRVNIKEGTPEYGTVTQLNNLSGSGISGWLVALILNDDESKLILGTETPRAIYSYELSTHEFIKIAGGGVAGADGKGSLAGFSYISYLAKYDDNNLLLTDNWAKLRKININPESSDYGLVTTLLTDFYNAGGIIKHPNLNELYFTTNYPDQNWPNDVNLINLLNYGFSSGFNIPGDGHFGDTYNSGIDISIDAKIIAISDYGNNKLFIQRLTDIYPPESISLSSSSATTGDLSTITVSSWDNDAPTRAEISVDGGAFVNLPRTALTPGEGNIGNTGTFSAAITMPHKTSAPYTLRVYDASGLVGKKTVTFAITDNDAPSVSRVQPLAGTTGDILTLSVVSSDNILVTKRQISVNSAPYVDMTGNNYELNVPFNSIDLVKVRVKAFDGAGNFAESTEYGITVTDNDPPEITNFTPPAELSEDKNTITVTSTDNIAPVKGTITLDGVIYENMKGDTSPFTYDVPISELKDKDELTYTIRVYDAAGNYTSTDEEESRVVFVPETKITESPKSFFKKVGEFFVALFTNPGKALKQIGSLIAGAFDSTVEKAIEIIKNTPPAVANTFPYILFILLGVMAAVFGAQARSEAVQARKLLDILKFEKAIYDDKENFLTLSAHYLRTPATLISNGADMLKDKVSKDKLSPIAKKLSNEIQEILQEIGKSHYLLGIKKPDIKMKKISLLLSPFLILPIVFVGITAVVANTLFIKVAEINISSVNLIAEVIAFLIVLQIFITFGRRRYTEKRNREEFEKTLSYERAIDKARNRFIDTVGQKITPYISEIEKLTPKSKDKMTNTILEGKHRLSDILYKFSLLSESTKGRFKLLNPKTVSLRTQARVTLGINEDVIKQKKLTIEEALGNGQIKTDPRKIEFIVSSIISNAIKFTKPNTKVTIEAQKKGKKTEITVIDQGPGISEEGKLHLFKPFTRTSSALDFNYEGFGLSLYLSKILTNSLGGDISLESKVGKGTTVRVVV